MNRISPSERTGKEIPMAQAAPHSVKIEWEVEESGKTAGDEVGDLWCGESPIKR